MLDEADQAFAENNWSLVHELAHKVLMLDSENSDAQIFLQAAEQGLNTVNQENRPQRQDAPGISPQHAEPADSAPTSFANGRYSVSRFLGEGGKKRVYLAQDTLLDRDVAFALIKTEGLDDVSRLRD